ncbi:MAG: hypothetical protein H8E55_08725 [Pelagibacterales bacterium]|nr:hypothetical protein [Pelagibacterales bacterium]
MKKPSLYIFLVLMWCNLSLADASKLWKFDDNYLTAKCFVHEWMSSDNFEDYYLKYGPKVIEAYSGTTQDMSGVQKYDFFFQRIGHYYKKYIPLNETFEASWGGDKLTLTTFLADCSKKKDFKIDYEKDFYEVVDNDKYKDKNLKTKCQLLSPRLVREPKCLDIKTIRYTQVFFPGSMPPDSQYNIYGIYELDNEKIILPLAFDVVVEKKEKKQTKVLRKDFFSWLSSQKGYSNTNQLIWDENFDIYINKTIPKIEVLLGFTKRKKEALIYSFRAVIGGPPDKLIYSEDRRYLLASACRPSECSSKGLIWFDTKDEKSIGLIKHSFWDELDFSKYEDNQILIFSSDYLELPSEFVNSVSAWMKKNEIVPSKVRFIKVDNSINDITKEFNK